MSRRATMVLVGLMAVAGLFATPAARAAEAPPTPAEPELAWRLDTLSSAELGPNQPDPAYRRSIALMDAAARLNPQEPRYPRLRTLALIRLGDVDGAITALRAYRLLVPGDRVAQQRLIDLYAAKLETADAKIAYLSGLLDKQDIAPEIRSHVAVTAATLLAQHSAPQAAAMAQRATQIYPLPEATRLNYEWSARQLPPPARVAALLAILRANPNLRIVNPGDPEDPNAMPYSAELASVLASAGLADVAANWYELALATILGGGPTRPAGFHDFVIDYAADLTIAAARVGGQSSVGFSQRADTLLGQMLDADPADADAWFLKLTLGLGSPEEVAQRQAHELARNALVRRWNQVAEQVLTGKAATQPVAAAAAAGAGGATGRGADVARAPAAPAAADATATSQPADATQPAAVQPASAAAVLKKLKAAEDPAAPSAVTNAAADIAWFDVYYDKQPEDAAKWIEVVRSAAGADAPVAQRLQGWLELAQDHPQPARDILAKVADRDALAELGLYHADAAEKKPATELARKLLAGHRAGLVAAIIWQDLRTANAWPATQPVADEISAAVQQFPRPWLQVLGLDPRTVRRIYTMRIEPLKAQVEFGEPLLAKVTIDNNSEYDVPVSAAGVVRPDLWFDAQIIGLDQATLPGIAYDEVAGQAVLRAHSTTSQVVRLDSPILRAALAMLPASATRVSGDVVTNPTTGQQGVVPGLGGLLTNFNRTFVSNGVAVFTPPGKKQLDAMLASASGAERIRALDVLAAYLRLAARPDADAELKKAVADLPSIVMRLRTDPSPPVAAWASYIAATTAIGDRRDHIVEEMSTSPDWSTRLLALFAAVPLPPQRQTQVASAMAEKDADPIVKAAAQATLDLVQQAATQPSTQPATQPANLPAAREPGKNGL